ncbi:MAG: DNA-3-methyladenine glycosylase family protein, partial [Burkholderiales bacterium]
MKPEYWDRAKRALRRNDPVMGAIIGRHPRVHLVARGDAFVTLARAIAGQQISVKAAQSVWNRLVAVVLEMTPERVLAQERPRLRACGLSDRKVEYIADLAKHFSDGTIQVTRWPQMADEEVIAELVQVRGIGRWTAEMLLMFSLLRPNVLPVDDLGLRRATSRHYFDGEDVGADELRAFGERWEPWRSVATWYLWR